MPLKKSKGNMYPWISHTHSHLGGECSHKCVYCYVDDPRSGRPEKFTGPIRLLEEEFAVKYGTEKTIFIEHMNDLFATDVPYEMILRVINHCKEWPDNTYVFQTKNPIRFTEFLSEFPERVILGSTIETNREMGEISKAPTPANRHIGMKNLPKNIRKFITVEPVLDFDVDVLAQWIADIRPEFLNLGADSKDHHLPEPTVEKIMSLVEKLKEDGIELREKHNLQRLLPK
jgi:DNA repair photolyase